MNRFSGAEMEKTRDIVMSISDSESRILQVLWEQSPLSADEIVKQLKDAGFSHPKTIKTLLNRLLKKGAIGFEEKSRKYHYYSLIDREDFYHFKTGSFLDSFFQGQLGPLISMFSDRTKLSDEDITELKKLIKKMEADHDRE